jgi:hypothetical protein
VCILAGQVQDQKKKVGMSHEIWRRVRRPFRYPCCRSQCKWEVYDANQAGCLNCGRHHFCHANAVDNTCPLIECDDRTRVCNVTGFVLPEVRHSNDEFHEAVAFSRPPQQALGTFQDLNMEVACVVSMFLTSQRARLCREQENAKQATRLTLHMHRQMKGFKLSHPGRIPNVCWLLGQAVSQEKYWRFIEPASEELVAQSAKHITACLLNMKGKGVKIASGARMQELVCGMLYMLKHGLMFQSRILLTAIPELDRCLPHENKIEGYFGVSSKVICMTENEVKLVFRESYQSVS